MGEFNMLKCERMRRGWSQRFVADMTGTWAYNVRRWEKGDSFPRPYYLKLLCELFHKYPDELFPGRFLPLTIRSGEPNLLKSERIQRGWSIQFVADQVGASTVSVGRWEHGYAFPDPYHLRHLCKLFNRSSGELFPVPLPPLSGSSSPTRELDKKASESSLLRRERKQRGWSQQELANQVKASRISVSRWENGLLSPDPYHLDLLCQLFGKNPSELFPRLSPLPSLLPSTSAALAVVDTNNSASHTLRRERKQRGWSQQELANQVDATRISVSRWENGLSSPDPYHLDLLCQLFGKNPSELFPNSSPLRKSS